MATNSANTPARGSLLDRLANSPRAQRRFGYISAAVLLAGIVAFVLVFVLHDRTEHQAYSNAPPKLTPPPGKHVKPSKDAFKVAREFLETAVLRKNMHEAYTLVAPPLKAGESRKEWESGNNPVIPYPAINAKTTGFEVVTSTKDSLYIQFQLFPRAGSGEKALTFHMELQKQKSGNWLVDYFEASNPYGVPSL